MATQSPFLLLENLAQGLIKGFQPPAWAIEELQRRVVLLLNHVLQQEAEATRRLARQQGRVVLLQWSAFSIRFFVTAAGLLDIANAEALPDLSLSVADQSPFELARALLQGDKPLVRIVGDVQLAAEVNWLVDHVRWDLEDDLSRIVGDASAHAAAQAVRRMAQSLRQFAGSRAATPGTNGKAA